MISESYLTGNSAVPNSAAINMGTAFNPWRRARSGVQATGCSQARRRPSPAITTATIVVDAADYTVWRNNLGGTATLPNDTTPGSVTAADYDVWKTNFGQTGGVSGTSTLITGFVKYVTSGVAAGLPFLSLPSVLLVGMGLSMVVGVRRQPPVVAA